MSQDSKTSKDITANTLEIMGWTNLVFARKNLEKLQTQALSQLSCSQNEQRLFATLQYTQIIWLALLESFEITTLLIRGNIAQKAT